MVFMYFSLKYPESLNYVFFLNKTECVMSSLGTEVKGNLRAFQSIKLYFMYI